MKPDQHVIQVRLDTSSEEFITVLRKFLETLQGKRIVSIQRVQNKTLWEFYFAKRKQMKAMDGQIGANEMNLFHGTKPDILQTVCTHNLDMRLAGTNVGAIYGNGTYFASAAKMSDSYATPDPRTGHKFMLQCRVLVGRWAKGQRGLRRPPELAQTQDGHVRLYDSCVDDVQNPSIFCIFDHVQYYPEFIIEYKTKEHKRENEVLQTSSCLPSHWVLMKPDQHVIQVRLDTSSEEFITVLRKFLETLRGKRIVSIQRVQNKTLWEFYFAKRKQMAAMNGKIGANEMNLFHGTKPDIIQTVCTHNLDMRLAGTNVGALYGKGTYFASRARMSDSYATPDPRTGHKFMLQCRVLVGRWAKGQPGLQRPPELAQTQDGHVRLYDSCVDDVQNPGIFCIFDHVQYYPEFIIEYK